MVAALLFIKRQGVYPAVAPSRMGVGGKYRQIYFPPRFNYSLDALREHNEDYYFAALEVICSLLDLNPEEEELYEQAVKAADNIFQTAFIKPIFEEFDNGFMMRFDIWSLYKNRYVSVMELEESEAEMLSYMMTRLFSVN